MQHGHSFFLRTTLFLHDFPLNSPWFWMNSGRVPIRSDISREIILKKWDLIDLSKSWPEGESLRRFLDGHWGCLVPIKVACLTECLMLLGFFYDYGKWLSFETNEWVIALRRFGASTNHKAPPQAAQFQPPQPAPLRLVLVRLFLGRRVPLVARKSLVGCWTNPLWKICSSKWESSTNRGENKKNIWVATTQIISIMKPRLFGLQIPWRWRWSSRNIFQPRRDSSRPTRHEVKKTSNKTITSHPCMVYIYIKTCMNGCFFFLVNE